MLYFCVFHSRYWQEEHLFIYDAFSPGWQSQSSQSKISYKSYIWPKDPTVCAKNQYACKGLYRHFCIHNKQQIRVLSVFSQFHFENSSLGSINSNFEPLVSLLLSNIVDKKEEGLNSEISHRKIWVKLKRIFGHRCPSLEKIKSHLDLVLGTGPTQAVGLNQMNSEIPSNLNYFVILLQGVLKHMQRFPIHCKIRLTV